MFRVGRDFGDYVAARNEALLAQGMGLGEYTWIYALTYHVWLGHAPTPAMGARAKKNGTSPFISAVRRTRT